MKEVAIKVYDFNELSDKAKERAHSDWLNDFDDVDIGDNQATLDAFEKIFPIKIKNWEYGYNRFINWTFTGEDEIADLCDIRLLAYLHNHYFDDLWKGQYYFSKINPGYDTRYSKIIKQNCCVLTGYYIDQDILDPIYKFMQKPYMDVTFKDVLDDCLHAWLKACETSYEYQQTEEYFKDICEANDYTFLDNGKMVNW
jgi:hypothetical protein